MTWHTVEIKWGRKQHPVKANTYDRNHSIFIDTQAITVSAAADYEGDSQVADPEQLLASSVASCHMLFFLAIAEANGFKVARYRDRASALLEEHPGVGKSVTKISIRPVVDFLGERPDPAAIERMHQRAHKSCFIAKSLKCEIAIELACEEISAK